MGSSTPRACGLLLRICRCRSEVAFPSPERLFHDYFVTHLPSSSLHPDSRSAHHQLPRAASKPHIPTSSREASPAPVAGVSRDTTVVRIPLRSAKHHFGVSVSRGTRPYNEDTYQAGVIEVPAFAKQSAVSLTRAPSSSPLQAYREEQRRKQEERKDLDDKTSAEATSAEGASGDPQVFYFGVFDGHGGTECSDFLRESLHEYIEDAARKFHLKSTLKYSKLQPVDDATRHSSPLEHRPRHDPADEKPKHAPPLPSTPALIQSDEPQLASALEDDLIKSWRTLVGGYFRRFKPSAFSALESKSTTMSTVLTYAFLRADLDFIEAQVRKTDLESDSVVSDAPLNASDVLDSPSYQIGGPKRFKGGSTCSVALISTPSPTPFWHPASPSTLIVAHVGDTRILLCKTLDGIAAPLTTDHHPSSSGEGERLRKYAATFVTDSFGEERMSGLANTRAFGDMQSKRLGVSAEPEIRRIEIAPAEYSFIVLVSDGISGTLADQEIVDIVKEAKTPEQGSKDVVAFATEVSSEGDNATCLVIRLGGWERRMEGGLGSMVTKESREWRKQEATVPRSRRD
ncbi:hypothetical protein MMC26_004146 [Xylographa opegraphella]|nr:hypothetical protein [Xylographa opegraphella]